MLNFDSKFLNQFYSSIVAIKEHLICNRCGLLWHFIFIRSSSIYFHTKSNSWIFIILPSQDRLSWWPFRFRGLHSNDFENNYPQNLSIKMASFEAKNSLQFNEITKKKCLHCSKCWPKGGECKNLTMLEKSRYTGKMKEFSI